MEKVMVRTYQFKELSPEVKRKVIESLKEKHSFAEVDLALFNFIQHTLDEKGIIHEGLKVRGKLDGDKDSGVFFVGNFVYEGKPYKVTNTSDKFYPRSCCVYDSAFIDEQKELSFLSKKINPFLLFFLEICGEAEELAYETISNQDEYYYRYVEESGARYLKNGIEVDSDLVVNDD